MFLASQGELDQASDLLNEALEIVPNNQEIKECLAGISPAEPVEELAARPTRESPWERLLGLVRALFRG